METVSAGYEFAHRDDYEGRHVLPTIKVDADSRNIEELTVHPDPVLYQERLTADDKAALKGKGILMNGYEGLMPEMAEGTLIIDDLNHHEAEVLIDKLKPSIFCAGIKEKYVIQKSGVPMKQLHNYDYSGPYAGFKGAVNFYQEIDRMVNATPFRLINVPWQERPEPDAAHARVG
jgi:nitrogenase molybdenum-iron protein alpha chain